MIERRRMTAGQMLCLGLGIASVTALLAVFFLLNDTAAAQTTTSAPVSGRQPIVTNQFNTTGAGAIQTRRPGLYIEQGIAINGGDTSTFTGVPEETPNFFRDSFDKLFEASLKPVQDLLDAVNYFIQSLATGSGSQSGITFIPPGNSVTTWQSGSVSVQ